VGLFGQEVTLLKRTKSKPGAWGRDGGRSYDWKKLAPEGTAPSSPHSLENNSGFKAEFKASSEHGCPSACVCLIAFFKSA
jgi:hypothetical protein